MSKPKIKKEKEFLKKQICFEDKIHCSGLVPIFERIILKIYNQALSSKVKENNIKEAFNLLAEEYKRNLPYKYDDLNIIINDPVVQKMYRDFFETTNWDNRILNKTYPIVYVLPINIESLAINIIVLFGVNIDSRRQLLGFWLDERSESHFWYEVFNNIKQKGVDDLFIVKRPKSEALTLALNQVYPISRQQKRVQELFNMTIKVVPYKYSHMYCRVLYSLFEKYDPEIEDSFYLSLLFNYLKKYKKVKNQWRECFQDVRIFFNLHTSVRRTLFKTMLYNTLIENLQK